MNENVTNILEDKINLFGCQQEENERQVFASMILIET